MVGQRHGVGQLDSGSLPGGLSAIHFQSGQFAIRGIPTRAGTSNFVLRVTDRLGHTTTKAFSLTCPTKFRLSARV